MATRINPKQQDDRNRGQDIDRDRDLAHEDKRDANRDPISKAPGAHPIGVGVGAATGGAAGAAIGSVVPGAGTLLGGAIGAVVGALGGGLVGKGVAEAIDPTFDTAGEDAYWRRELATRPYYDTTYTYDIDYAPAFAYGYVMYPRFNEPFAEVEPELRNQWQTARGQSRLGWVQAKDAVEDAWNRADSRKRAGQRGNE